MKHRLFLIKEGMWRPNLASVAIGFHDGRVLFLSEDRQTWWHSFSSLNPCEDFTRHNTLFDSFDVG